MKRTPFAALVACLSVCFLSPLASAQLSNLDEAGKRFAAEFKTLKPHPAIVNVADFSSRDNSLLSQAHYFAWYLSNSLEVRGKDFLLVRDHREFDKHVSRIKPSSDSVLSAEDLPKISSQIGGDFIIVGTVAKKGSSYLLNLQALRVSDGTFVDSDAVEVHTSEFLESLSIPLQEHNRAGVNGIAIPSCPHPPDPSYTDVARGADVNGTVVMEVIISVQGTVQQVHLLKLLGYGLDEQAYNTVKRWKWEPAHDIQGNPVAVVTPVEFTFRLF